MTAHSELAVEQAHVDRVYERLDDMQRQAREGLVRAVRDGTGGTHQALYERDVMVAANARRLAELQTGGAALCFGRIDPETGERLYVGRVGVSDEDHEPLLVDWRAPAAEPFYRATGRHAMGLRRRRHFRTRGRQLLGIDDELLGEGPADEDAPTLVGEGALLATIERSRTGRMGDIVATIQREQDEIIRAPLPGVLVVQGGPGTGKTAVALHRAAYLLYTHRFPLERQGVLVVGPNPVFVRYIEQVLPALGETGVALASTASLMPGIMPAGRDPGPVRRVKGDARMAGVVAGAVRSRERAVPTDVSVPYGAHRLTLSRGRSRRIVTSVRRQSGTHNARRRRVEQLVERHLFSEYQAALARAGRLRPTAEERAEFRETVMAEPVVRAALDRMWPRLTPEELLHDLFGSPALIRDAAQGALDAGDLALLHRPRSATWQDVDWTEDDVALLDEAAHLLGGRHDGPGGSGADGQREYAQRVLEELGLEGHLSAESLAERFTEDNGFSPTDIGPGRAFGHVIVDEAQDLSPMQWRMVARRAPGRSMTLVGDLAQASGPWPAASWPEALAPLGSRRPVTVCDLTVNYRTPAQIMDIAARVLAASRPDLAPPRSVRRTEEQPLVVCSPAGALARAAADTARAEQQRLGDGTVAVIAPAGLVSAVGQELRAAVDTIEVLDAGIGALTVDRAKGLEFDGVVVVEPGRIAVESPGGLQALYVALTRCTRRLAIVHAEPLPAPLRPAV